MERECEPFLPHGRVKKAFISAILPDDITSELTDYGITVYRLGRSKNILSELAYHPDILVNNFRKGMWICESGADYLPAGLPDGMFRESENELSTFYPFDCPFNNYRLGRSLICGKSVDYLIKAYATYEDLNIIYVPQNYAKCCSVIVNDYSVITCDYYIGRFLKEHGYNVLTVGGSADIRLNGYSSGMIGGCAAKLAPDLLVFTGDINKYEHGESVRDFCADVGVDVFSLSSRPLYDYGGILPITEIVPENS